MQRVFLFGISVLAIVVTLSGCSFRDVGDFAMNTAVHPNTSDLVRSVEHTAEEIADEEQAERVEELNTEYEEFLRENSRDPDEESEAERSIIVVDPEDRY